MKDLYYSATATVLALAVATAVHASVPACDKAQTSALLEPEDRTDYRLPDTGPIRYPFGSRKAYGFDLEFVVGPDGRVTCADISSQINPTDARLRSDNIAIDVTPQRQALLDATANAVFKPFMVSGQAASVYIDAFVREEQLPKYHVPAPKADPLTAHIHQEWQPDLVPGASAYRIDIYGDGRVVYQGGPNDPFGRHTYTIGADAVAALLAKADETDFWSLDDESMKSPVMLEHSAAKSTTIELGGRSNRIGYASNLFGGEPKAVGDLQSAIQAAAHVDWWNRLPAEAMDHLESSGYSFNSARGRGLLMWALRNDDIGDDTIRRLVKDGVPVDVYVANYNGLVEGPLIAALEAGRTSIARNLIGRGALEVAGKPDRARIDSAFIATLDAGLKPQFDMILPYKPDLMGPDVVAGKKRASVLFWLARGGHKPDIAAIAEALLAMGAPVDARDASHVSVLSLAAETDQLDLVRVLLARGASANAIDDDDEPPLAQAYTEQMALLLLNAGADPRKLNGGYDGRFAANVDEFHWANVRAWLAAHGYGDWLAEALKRED